MALNSLAALVNAFENGQFHIQRFQKNAGPSAQSRWVDWTFSSGQPAYDAKIGNALAFTPLVAAGNDAIWFPGIDPSMERRLVGGTFRSDSAGGVESCIIADVLGYYPLIDGDSTDQQVFDNTQTLPRYADGVGLVATIVSSVAPMTTDGTATITYVGTDDVSRTTAAFRTVNTAAAGQIIVSGSPTALSSGGIAIPLNSGAKGIKRVTSLTYSVPPSGLACLYIMRVLGSVITNGNQFVATEADFGVHKGFNYPRIYDGAYLNLFHMHPSGNNTSGWFGNLTFAWG